MDESARSPADFEALLSELSESFSNLPAYQLDAEIDHWLKRLVEFLGSARCSLAEVTDNGQLLITHTYSASSVPPVLRAIAELPWYSDQLRQGRLVELRDLPASLPDEAAVERELVTREGMKAHVGIPLMVRGSLVGAVGMAWFRTVPQLPQVIVSRLRLVGEVFANVLVRKLDGERLQRSELRFQTLLENAPDAMLLVAAEGQIVLMNHQAELLFGYERSELLGRPAELLVPDALRAKYFEHRQRFRSDPRAHRVGGGLILHGQRKDGSQVPIEVSLCPVRTEDNWVVSVLIRDITKQMQTEHALRELSGRLITAQEEERRRVARELHDDVSQRLALLAVGLDQIAHTSPMGAPALHEQVKQLLVDMKGLSSDVHGLSHQLHPSTLDHLGLVSAIKGFCQEYSRRRGIQVRFHSENVPTTLRQDISLCLFRLVQEALGNVAKHSGASEAEVRLLGSVDSLRLQVSDAGVGFDPASLNGRLGLGLTSMGERLRLVHGTMSIDSGASRGTRVEVTIPLSAMGDR